ncbi:UNVERIFIED_CONTAM: hypothetical protein NCL1_60220 [Trichonephila clavipes]
MRDERTLHAGLATVPGAPGLCLGTGSDPRQSARAAEAAHRRVRLRNAVDHAACAGGGRARCDPGQAAASGPWGLLLRTQSPVPAAVAGAGFRRARPDRARGDGRSGRRPAGAYPHAGAGDAGGRALHHRRRFRRHGADRSLAARQRGRTGHAA